MLAETLLPLGKLDPGLEAPETPLDVTTVAADSQLVETLGYHALVLEETKDDPFALLALAAANTKRMHIGTSVAIAFARSPFVTAMSAWTLQKLSNGRFELGLGSQVRAHIQRRYGLAWHAPGPWMRDYVGALRAIWRGWQQGEPINFSSERYQLDLSVPLFTPAPIEHPQIPITVAAVNPYMCQVAGEIANGVRLHPVCAPDYIANVVVPAVRKGRQRAVMAASDVQLEPSNTPFELCLKPLIATASNRQTLAVRVEVARARLAFYLSTPAYRRAFEHFGLGDAARAASALARAQRWQELAATVSDDMLDRWVIVATYDNLADELLRRYATHIHRIEVSIPITLLDARGNATDQVDPAAQALLREVVATLQQHPGAKSP